MTVLPGLSPLRHREFRYLAAGQLASNVGDAFYAVALPWYLLAGNSGPVLLGTVLVAYGVPRTVLLAVGGPASDRWGPATVMIGADVVRAIALAALTVAAFSGPPQASILVPIAIVLGVGEGLFLPGSFAIIPSLVPDKDLQAANALASGGTQLALLCGPAAGGAVLALIGPGAGFAVDAVSFLVSALTLAAIRTRKPVAAPLPPSGDRSERPRFGTLLRKSRVIQMMVLITVAANLGNGGVSAVALPSLAYQVLHASAAEYGALLAAFGAGALVGTLAAGNVRGVRKPALVGAIAYVGQAVLMAVTAYLGSVVAVGAALAGFGLLNAFGNVVMITAYQRWAPPGLLGRVTGLLMLSAFGTYPVSVALATTVVNFFGAAPFFPFAGCLVALALLGGLFQPDWRNLGRQTEMTH